MVFATGCALQLEVIDAFVAVVVVNCADDSSVRSALTRAASLKYRGQAVGGSEQELHAAVQDPNHTMSHRRILTRMQHSNHGQHSQVHTRLH
jgi:hypothetical protein